ncbi:Multidrug resistance protein MdtN [Roseimaritima multifibrata]|uniref:Multidrug resistance protein MdtN n=1 Tax=Roseimaritima multifibrata TaxID=1930274 RepID=A0A517MKL2_9BACT|nr:HlyD family efflux transporter periplasmic adaptor subunit [Roseimaritima multifibrata]QDS95423.1 Multidrug resistance protein MdtN [Roseimaritima multifibrata]
MRFAFAVFGFLAVTGWSGLLLAAEPLSVPNAQVIFIHDVAVSSLDSGVVTEVIAVPNQVVDQGEPLVILDRQLHDVKLGEAVQRWRIAQAEGQNHVDLRFAQKSVSVSQNQLDRGVGAVQRVANSVSESELEQMRLEVEQAVLSVEQAEHQLNIDRLTESLRAQELKVAEMELERRTVRSPRQGQVAEVLVQVGEWVEAGTPVVRVVDAARLRVVGFVPEENLEHLNVGAPAIFRIQTGDDVQAVEGKVSFVSPELNPVNRDCLIWVDIDTEGKTLRPGQSGVLEFELSEE